MPDFKPVAKILGIGGRDDVDWQTHDCAFWVYGFRGRDPDGGVLNSVKGRQP